MTFFSQKFVLERRYCAYEFTFDFGRNLTIILKPQTYILDCALLLLWVNVDWSTSLLGFESQRYGQFQHWQEEFYFSREQLQ